MHGVGGKSRYPFRERESGRRAILNFGHTFGHALEKLNGYEQLTHGEAIAIGMTMAAELAVLLECCPNNTELLTRQDHLFVKLGLPIKTCGFSDEEISELEALGVIGSMPVGLD